MRKSSFLALTSTDLAGRLDFEQKVAYMRTAGDVLLFELVDIPSKGSLVNAVKNYADFDDTLFSDVLSEQFGSSDSEWVAGLYLQGLSEGLTFESMGLALNLPSNHEGMASGQLRYFAQLSRIGRTDFDGFWFCSYPELKKNTPTQDEYVDYYALIFALYGNSRMFGVAANLLEPKLDSSLTHPQSLGKIISLRKRLVSEGVVLTMKELRLAVSFFDVEDVLDLVRRRFDVAEAAQMMAQGANGIEELLEIHSEIPDVWMDELFGALTE